MRYSITIGLCLGAMGHYVFALPSGHEVLLMVVRHHYDLAALPVTWRIGALLEIHSPGLYVRVEVLYAFLWFTAPWAVSFLFTTSGNKRHRVEEPGKLPDYVAPELREELYVTVGEVHEQTGQGASKKPVWKVIPERGLYGGLALIGPTGSGKTNAIEQLIEQIFNFKRGDEREKCSALFLEVKGDFSDIVLRKAEEAGRAGDIRMIGEWVYNPFGNDHLPSSELADAMTGFMVESGISGGSLEAPFWRHAGASLIGNAIELLRLTDGWPTMTKIYHLIGDPDAMNSKLVEADEKINGDIFYTFTKQTRRNREEKLDGFGAVLHEDDGLWWAPYSRGLDEYCHPEAYYLRARGRSKSRQEVPHGVSQQGGIENRNLKRRLATLRFDITKLWKTIPEERWSEIALAASQTMKLFMYPGIEETLSPPRDDPKLLPPMEKLMNEGCIVVVKFDASDEKVSKLISTMLKLDYYRAIMTRFKDRGKKHRRTILVIDEYPELASRKDARARAMLRAANCMAIFAYAGCKNLELAVGRDWEALEAMTNSRIWFGANDTLTARRASEICGTRKVWKPTPSMSQGRLVRQVSASVSRTETREPLFKPEDFLFIPVGQCIALTWDGIKKQPATRVHLRSAAIPSGERYRKSALKIGGLK